MLKALIITGPSGSGKTTLARALLKKFPRFRKVVSVTTRQMRPGEKEAKDYYFMSRLKFRWLVGTEQLFEWKEYDGALVGSERRVVRKIVKQKHRPLFVVEPKGALTLKKIWGDEALVLFLQTTLPELKRRLTVRGDLDAPAIARRLSIARRELPLAKRADAVIPNRRNRFRETLKQASQIIRRSA